MSNELNVKNGIQERRDVMAKMVGTLAYAGGLTVVDGEKNNPFVILNDSANKELIMVDPNSVSKFAISSLYGELVSRGIVKNCDTTILSNISVELDTAMQKAEPTTMGIAGLKSLSSVGEGFFDSAVDYVKGFMPTESFSDKIAVNSAI